MKLAADLRVMMADLSDEQRLEVLAAAFKGYCTYCGGAITGRECYCMRDD